MEKEIVEQGLQLIADSWTEVLPEVLKSSNPEVWYQHAPNNVARFLMIVGMYIIQKDETFMAQYMNLWKRDEKEISQDIWMLSMHKNVIPLLDKTVEKIQQFHKNEILKKPTSYSYSPRALFDYHFKSFVDKQFQTYGLKWKTPYLQPDIQNIELDQMPDNHIRRAPARHFHWDQFEELSKKWIQSPDDPEINKAWQKHAIFWNHVLHKTTGNLHAETIKSYAEERMTKTLTWSKPASNLENLKSFLYSWNVHDVQLSRIKIYARLPHPYAISLYVALSELANAATPQNSLLPKRQISTDMLNLLIKSRSMRVEKLKNNNLEKESICQDLWVMRQLYLSRNAAVPKYTLNFSGYDSKWEPKDQHVKKQ